MATAAMKRQEDTEPNNNSGSEEVKMTALWLQRLGTLFPSNASLKEETLQPPADESLSLTRGGRLSAEDVLRNVTSSASIGSNTSSNAPSSILKSDMVHSNAIDNNPHVDEEAAKDTVYMLRLLMMSDFFTGKDRVNLGLPAAESHPNTSPFKPDSSVVSAVKTPHVNLDESKEEEWGGEEDNEQLLSDVAPEANTGHPPQPQARSLTSLLSYKPRRAHSSNSIGENASTNTSEESFSSSAKALRSSSTHTARTQSPCNSDSQPSSTKEEEQLNRLKAELLGQSDEDVGAIKANEEHPTQMILDSTMLSNYKPERKISPPSSEKNLLSGRISRSGPVFESFNTMGSTPSTGTFRDTKKRFVPTLANSSESQDQDTKTRNNSWGNLKEKPSSNDNMTSPLSAVTSMLKQKDLFPSTGTFRDSAKRHVRIRSESNQEWDVKPRNVGKGTMLSRPSMPSSEKAAAAAPPGPAEDSVSNFLKDNIFPSTGTFRDTDKRHVRHITVTEPSVNQEWELKCQNHRKAKSFSGPSIGFSLSTGSIRDASKRQVGSRHHHQQELEGKPSNPNQEWGKLAPCSPIDTPDAEVNGSEPKKQTNLLQLYMENKAKLARESQPKHQPSVNREAGIPPNAEAEAEPSEAAELLEQAPKGELLVDWGDQGADSLEDDESLEEEENNGTITFVKNDSSRRISDITTVDDFDDDDDDLGLDASFEMRERIRSLSIPEEPIWMQSNDNDEESSDEKQYNNSSRRISDITTDDDFDDELDLGLVASLEMRQRIRNLSIPEERKWIQSHEESDEKQEDGLFLADTEEVVGGEKAPPTGLVLVRRNSDDTSASSETVKTSGRKGDAIETSTDNNSSSVEMGKGLIRNMSAITLHEMSDEELDDSWADNNRHLGK